MYSFGLKCFAGICTWRNIDDTEKTITCSQKIGKGVIEYGILKETGSETSEEDNILFVEGKKYKLIPEE